MKNCDAGIKHITFAPDGKFYLCPAFFSDNDYNIGDLVNGINIINQQLLTIEYSRICSICDAYHCKRCIYLNKKMTNEINIPSHEQCVTSHFEREASRKLWQDLKNSGLSFNNNSNIPEIDYLDPFEIIDKWNDKNEALEFKFRRQDRQDLEDSSIKPSAASPRDLLIKILEIENEILTILKQKGNYEAKNNC